MPNNCCGCNCEWSGVKLEPFINPERARMMTALVAASQSIPKGTPLGELTASPGTFGPYDPLATDGRQVFKGFAVYDMETNADGCFVSCCGGLGAFLVGGAPYYWTGAFKTTDLNATPALIAAIVAAGDASFVMGNASNGIISIR